VLVCTKLKTEVYEKSVRLGDTVREPIVRKGEIGWEMIVVLDGIINVSAAESEPEIKEFLSQDDEQAREHAERKC
jgi:hypothetical protein